MKTNDFLIIVPGRDDLRVRMSVTLEEDMRFPTPLEVERWEEVPDQVIMDRMRAVLREVNRVDEGQESIEEWVAVELLQRRRREMLNFVVNVQKEEEDASTRWAPVQDEPEFAEGWNAYRRELLETVGMTMLPTWENLPEQVKESWCHGVRVAMGRD